MKMFAMVLFIATMLFIIQYTVRYEVQHVSCNSQYELAAKAAALGRWDHLVVVKHGP